MSAGPDGGALRASCLRPCMLLILSEGPACTRALGDRLGEFGFHCDARTVGRRLHAMERCGLVCPCEDRRRYRLTRRGRARLDSSAEAIRRISVRLEAFLSRCAARV